eukprot:scaffold18408_cov61-Phaeocystis_antarctica.AAC.6
MGTSTERGGWQGCELEGASRNAPPFPACTHRTSSSAAACGKVACRASSTPARWPWRQAARGQAAARGSRRCAWAELPGARRQCQSSRPQRYAEVANGQSGSPHQWQLPRWMRARTHRPWRKQGRRSRGRGLWRPPNCRCGGRLPRAPRHRTTAPPLPVSIAR